MINLTKSKAINTLIGQIVLIYIFTLVMWVSVEPVIRIYFLTLTDFQILGVKALLPFGLVLWIAIRHEPPLPYIVTMTLATALGVSIAVILGPFAFLKFLLGLGTLLLLALLFVRLGDI